MRQEESLGAWYRRPRKNGIRGPSFLVQSGTERAVRCGLRGPEVLRGPDRQGTEPFSQAKVLTIVDRDFDERRPRNLEGAHQGRIVVGRGGDPEAGDPEALGEGDEVGFPNSTPNGRPNSFRCFQSMSP